MELNLKLKQMEISICHIKIDTKCHFVCGQPCVDSKEYIVDKKKLLRNL